MERSASQKPRIKVSRPEAPVQRIGEEASREKRRIRSLRTHQAPGFPILFVMATARSAIREEEQPFVVDLFDRNYVPDIDRNEVGDQDVDLRGCVLALFAIAASSMHVITT